MEFLLLSLIFSEINADKLRFALEIFRHGARSPYLGFKKDMKTDLFSQVWSGFQELTDVGKRQHYLLGFRNRQRYIVDNKLLSEVYNPMEILITSTDVNRTIDSASAQLQGLYTPGTSQKLNFRQIKLAAPPIEESLYIAEKNLLNDSVIRGDVLLPPVHVFQRSERYFSMYRSSVCKGAKDNLEKQHNDEKVRGLLGEIYNKYKDNEEKLLEKMHNESAMRKGFFKNFMDAYVIFDTFMCELLDARNLSHITETIEPNLTKFKEYADQILHYDLEGALLEHTKDNIIYGLSPVYRQIIKWMDEKIAKDKSDEEYIGYDLPKFVMYSAHDSTVVAFQAYLKLCLGIDVKFTPFATNAYIELWQKEDKSYYIKYMYNKENEIDLDYEVFKKNVTKIMKTQDEIDEFCGANASSAVTTPVIIGFVVAGVVIVALVVAVIILAVKLKKQGRPTISNIKNDNLMD